MSTQRSLADYGAQLGEREASVTEADESPQRPSWAPDEDDNTGGECLGCEAHVTAEFSRVMGDNTDTVYACPQCANGGELARGAAADPDYEHRVDIDNGGI